MATSILHCTVKPFGRESQLVATQRVAQGDVVLKETPLLQVPEFSRQWSSYAWEMVDRLLSNPSLFQQYRRWRLMAHVQLMHPDDLANESAMLQKHHKSRQLVRELYFSVGTNNVAVLNAERSRIGFGLYEYLSRADHSCVPNARLEGTDAGTGELMLVAYRDITPGEPVTWSYFREDEFLGADFEARNYGLVNIFRFACRCPRCVQERPAHLVGNLDLVAYFDKLIAEHAQELVQSSSRSKG
jgi:hypothetical protein